MKFRLVLATAVALSPSYTFAQQRGIQIGDTLVHRSAGSAKSPLGKAKPFAVAGAAAVSSSEHLGRYENVLEAVASAGTLATRGAKETRVYQQASGSVVLIVAKDSLGSGALISNDGLVITNWHVVGNASEVGVVFKPATEGAEATEADMQLAKVVKIDQMTDLALLQVPSPPKRAKPLTLGSSTTLPVGADVHAIGHPTGEAWT